jgi:hypothetical protein
MVGLGRFELPTSRLSSARSNQLSYRPDSINKWVGVPVSVHPLKKEKRRRRHPAVFLRSQLTRLLLILYQTWQVPGRSQVPVLSHP